MIYSAAVDGAGADGITASRSRRSVDGHSEGRRLQLRRHIARDSLPRRTVPLCRRRRVHSSQE